MGSQGGRGQLSEFGAVLTGKASQLPETEAEGDVGDRASAIALAQGAMRLVDPPKQQVALRAHAVDFVECIAQRAFRDLVINDNYFCQSCCLTRERYQASSSRSHRRIRPKVEHQRKLRRPP